jgi:hypothetical protein
MAAPSRRHGQLRSNQSLNRVDLDYACTMHLLTRSAPCEDYRIEGPDRWKTMRLHPHEFIRRFLMHVLPRGFHRIRHYGLFANANRADNIATARALLGADPPAANAKQQPDVTPDAPRALRSPCPRCGARMIVIEVFARGCEPRWRPTPSTIDTS